MWQVASETGWTLQYILEGVNYQTLILMLKDAPRYVRRRKKSTGKGKSELEEALEVAGFFQSLKKEK